MLDPQAITMSPDSDSTANALSVVTIFKTGEGDCFL